MLVPPESSSAVLVIIRSKFVSICNHSRARSVDSSKKIARFQGGTQIWCARTEDSLNLGGQTLHRWNLRLIPNISCAIVLVCLEWFRRNSLLKCVLQPNIAKNSLKPYFGGSRSFRVTDVGTPGKLVSSACYDAQQVCLYLQPFSRWMSQ